MRPIRAAHPRSAKYVSTPHSPVVYFSKIFHRAVWIFNGVAHKANFDTWNFDVNNRNKPFLKKL